MKRYKTVNEYIFGNKEWKDSLKRLRKIIITTELEETIKWGVPVYTIDGKNIVGLGAFKSYVGLWFFQGALLKDKKKKFVNAQEGITKALRQLRFNSEKEIDDNLVIKYLKEAIQNHKEAKEIKPFRKSQVTVPKELNTVFKKNAKVKKNFDQLTPYKRREYCEYVTDAKREATKSTRIKKIIPMILKGIGLNDEHRK
jgi:uncharacterized protein YdeI (YjbR/CyaY-like superfamily)